MIYPPTYPPHKTEHAEEQVYQILKTLDPDRYDVFYDRRFAQMRPGERRDYQVDFLIADLGVTKSFGKYPIAMISKDTGQTSAEHVNVATIRNFKGLEADVVFILDTDKMEKEDKRVLYTQASRARLWLGVFGKK